MLVLNPNESEMTFDPCQARLLKEYPRPRCWREVVAEMNQCPDGKCGIKLPRKETQ